MSTVNADNYRQIVVNEQKLFHTACPEAVEIICEQNFDRSSQETYLSLLEKENHFALNASYIDGLEHKCSKKDANSSKLMFLAKVLVGSWTKGFYSYTSPPQKDPLNSASDRYDSYVDDETNPTIFVVFNTNQVYPEYIIEYSEESQLAPCDLIADNSSHRDSKTRAMGSKTLLSQSEHYQTPPLGPQASQTPQMQTQNFREPLIQTKVLEAPPLESPFSEEFISQDQVYQALLSQARVYLKQYCLRHSCSKPCCYRLMPFKGHYHSSPKWSKNYYQSSCLKSHSYMHGPKCLKNNSQTPKHHRYHAQHFIYHSHRAVCIKHYCRSILLQMICHSLKCLQRYCHRPTCHTRQKCRKLHFHKPLFLQNYSHRP